MIFPLLFSKFNLGFIQTFLILFSIVPVSIGIKKNSPFWASKFPLDITCHNNGQQAEEGGPKCCKNIVAQLSLMDRK